MQEAEKKKGRGGARPGAGRRADVRRQLRVRLDDLPYSRLLHRAEMESMSPAAWAAETLSAALEIPLPPPAATQPQNPALHSLEMPPVAVLDAEVGAVVAYEARVGGQVAVLPEEGRWCVWWFPSGSDESPALVEAETREEAEIIARQTALATGRHDAGGHGLL